jgi:hypothetical protein
MSARYLATVAFCVATAPALASSEDAWKEFRAKVSKSCEKAVAGRLEKPQIAVDPFGSDSYGVAIARGVSTDSKAPRVIVCVFDKRSGKAEASGDFEP